MTTDKRIALKDFIEKYTEILNSKSKAGLIAILVAMANEVEPNARRDFLNKLYQQKQKEQTPVEQEILDEIDDIKNEIIDRTKEEPDWESQDDEDSLCGYEEFVSPLLKIVDKIETVFDYGHYMIARKAYEELFKILDIQDDYGRGIGIHDLEDVDFSETTARYFRSVYLTEKPDTRVGVLLNVMENIEKIYFHEQPKLSDIVNVSVEVLPEFSLFLTQFITATQENQKPQYDAWNREATMLLHGISGMKILAEKEGNARPKIYIDLIQGLIDEKNYESALSEAEAALKQLSQDRPIRAAIADLMILCGNKLNDKKVQFDGEWLSFEAKPSLLKLVKIYKQCDKCSLVSQMQNAAEIIERHIKKSDRSCYHKDWENDDLDVPSAPDAHLLLHAYLLSNQNDKAFELAKKGQPLGWSSSDNPKAFFVAHFLVLSTKKPLERLPTALKKFWSYALDISLGYFHNYGKSKNELFQEMERIYQNLFLSSCIINDRILTWCLAEAEKRIVAIVSGQHRKAYERAAILTVACVETLELINGAEAIKFFSKIKNQFPRHMAFQSELKRVK